jgi:hypothetical protein
LQMQAPTLRECVELNARLRRKALNAWSE